MGYLILLALVASMFVVVLVRTQREDRASDAVRGAHANQPVLFEGPVDVHYRLRTGWSLKPLAHMQVVVRPGLVDVYCRFPIVGSDWVFPEHSARLDEPNLALRPGPWVVLESVRDTREAVALCGRERHAEMASAIRASGVVI